MHTSQLRRDRLPRRGSLSGATRMIPKAARRRRDRPATGSAWAARPTWRPVERAAEVPDGDAERKIEICWPIQLKGIS
jgi:hypothetical protein